MLSTPLVGYVNSRKKSEHGTLRRPDRSPTHGLDGSVIVSDGGPIESIINLPVLSAVDDCVFCHVAGARTELS